MLFNKLFVILLSILVSEDSNSTNCHISIYLLENYNQVKSMKITDLAKACNVSNSSISRFCREIGLEDFSELKEMFSENTLEFEINSNKITPKLRTNDYTTKINHYLTLVEDSLDYNLINQLCHDIHNHSKIVILGLMKAQTAAMNLQSDLLFLGKTTFSSISIQQQINTLKQIKENDLVIIFSYTGTYFDYYNQLIPKLLNQSNVYLITGNKQLPKNTHFNNVITFDSPQNQLAHPYQLQFVASIIAQEYSQLIK